MTAPARAMEKSGAAVMIGDHIVKPARRLWSGRRARRTLPAGDPDHVVHLQHIDGPGDDANRVRGGERHGRVGTLPMVMSVAMRASSSFLTPFANGVSLMVHGPCGDKFGDFWPLGLVVLIWTAHRDGYCHPALSAVILSGYVRVGAGERVMKGLSCAARTSLLYFSPRAVSRRLHALYWSSALLRAAILVSRSCAGERAQHWQSRQI